MVKPKNKTHIELHAHPNFDSYGLEKVVKAMKKKELDIVALIDLDRPIFEQILAEAYYQTKKNKTSVEDDSLAVVIRKEKRKYIEEYIFLKGIELTTKDNFHLITIGYNQVPEKPEPIRKIIDTALEKEALVIFDHPLVDNANVRKELSREQEEEIKKICRDYTGRIALEWNAHLIPWVRKLLGGSDANKRTRFDFSYKLYQDERVNAPIVTDTDLHAKNKYGLGELGRARIKIDNQNMDKSSGRAIIDSLKENIFAGKYENTYEYVSFLHFTFLFGLPYLLNPIKARFAGKH